MADMGWIGMIIQLAGAQAGQAASAMDKAAAMELIKKAMDEFGNINIPKMQELFLQKAPDTLLSGIKDDPRYRSQQNAADAQLNDVITSGGLTLADKAALNALRNKSTRDNSANNNAIRNQMAARGTLDSGAQLAMQLNENQRSAEEASAQDANTAGVAQRRAYEAILQRSRNAGEGLDRDYRQQANAASAQDSINRGNTDIANVAAKYNVTRDQQDFENKLRLAAAKAGPTYAFAGANAANAKDTQQYWNGVGQTAGAAANSAANSWEKNSGSTGGRKIIGRLADGTPVYADEVK